LKIEVAADAVLRGNTDLWRHLIGNLLSNAAEYSPEGSQVMVRTGPAFLLEVTNPAPDLRDADLQRMFDRLWRGDRARSGDDHCGLGLSIVMACAKALEVELDVILHANSDLTMRLRAGR
jgi:signal transduction histidine kinase